MFLYEYNSHPTFGFIFYGLKDYNEILEIIADLIAKERYF